MAKVSSALKIKDYSARHSGVIWVTKHQNPAIFIQNGRAWLFRSVLQ